MSKRRNWRIAAQFVGVGCLVLSVPACKPSSMTNSGEPQEFTSGPVEVGAPLYQATTMPTMPAMTPKGEPIVIPNAVVQNDLRVQVPAAVDAVVDMIAMILPEGTPVDPNDADILFHPRDKERKQPYRRLRIGDVVKKGDLLARLDEQLVYLQVESLKSIENAIKTRLDAEIASEKAQKEVLDTTRNLPAASLSKSDYLEREALYYRYVASRTEREQELVKNRGEFDSAVATWNRYYTKAPISGRIMRILKQPGEFAKVGETILELQSTDRIRVEGKLDAGYAFSVRRGMKVYVEPSRPVGPNPLTTYHRQEVTSIAVTSHPDRPMIVSGGLDETTLVWDVTKTKQTHRLPNPNGVGVRAVATTGAKAKGHFVAVGGDDGKIRLWDLSNADKLPTEPSTVLDEAHSGAIHALAYSPDGKYLASASGRDVFVWDLTEAKKLYALPMEHRSAVHAVHFTPQATLITISQDNSIRNWQIGTTGAVVQTLIDHRGGSVEVLGVSSDGSRVLFDKDPSRLDVVSLADQRSVGTVQNPSGSARFAKLAIFSNDDKQILTIGADNNQRGVLTEWETPAPGGRGSERRQLITPRNNPVTCAAYSSDPVHRFIAVGTADGGVYFWNRTSNQEQPQRIVGEIVAIVPRDARSVDVQVEISITNEKQGDGLQDRGIATIIIPPEAITDSAIPNVNAVPVPAALPAAAPEGVLPAGGLQPAVGSSANAVPKSSGIVPASASMPASPTPGEMKAAPMPSAAGLNVPANPTVPEVPKAMPPTIPTIPTVNIPPGNPVSVPR